LPEFFLHRLKRLVNLLVEFLAYRFKRLVDLLLYLLLQFVAHRL